MPTRIDTSRTIALVVSALGLLSACGLGTPNYTPPPPDLITVSSQLLTFRAAVGAESPPQQITVTNTTGNAVTITQRLEALGKGSVAYKQETTCGASLSASTTCTFTLVFAPTPTNNKYALLWLQFGRSEVHTVHLNGSVETSPTVAPTAKQ